MENLFIFLKRQIGNGKLEILLVGNGNLQDTVIKLKYRLHLLQMQKQLQIKDIMEIDKKQYNIQA